jgi:peptidoglycan-associated lipoprotein
MRTCIRFALALILIAILMSFPVSCAKEAVQTQPEAIPQPEIQNTSEAPPQPAEPDEQLQDEAAARKAAETAAFINEKIYFDLNSAALTDLSQRLLSRKAEYMRVNQDVMITVEGHCDERGPNSYNLVLGQRRAESVKSFLVDSGIGGNRVDTVSFGEERPISLEQNEAAWAKNRRAQFVMN